MRIHTFKLVDLLGRSQRLIFYRDAFPFLSNIKLSISSKKFKSDHSMS